MGVDRLWVIEALSSVIKLAVLKSSDVLEELTVVMVMVVEAVVFEVVVLAMVVE